MCPIEVDETEIFPYANNIVKFKQNTDYGITLVKAGVFPSIRSAWSYGYKGNIPVGWSDIVIANINICIYNPPELNDNNNSPWWGTVYSP
jgi:hypothetical protein